MIDAAELLAFTRPMVLATQANEPESAAVTAAPIIEPMPEPVDLADLLAELMPEGWDQLDLAKRTGKR